VGELIALYEARQKACGCAPKVDEPPPSACKPWLKVERDEKRYEACMAIAEKIGPINVSKKAFSIISAAVGAEDQEVFGALYLDTHMQVRGLAETGRGEIDATMAPLIPTLRIAIETGAQGLIIFHTHPTLYVEPSEADVEVTHQFDKACRTVGLMLADHLIIGGRGRYFSFLDQGILQ
jgi:DNA repair protein RadC